MKILEQTAEHVPPSSLTPHPRNPRQGDVGAIHESIRTNGWYGVIVAQRSTGHILVGNHRWEAARQLKADTVPVHWVDVDDEHALRILLADNRTNDLATYDDSELASLLKGLIETTGTLEGTGYDGDDLDELLADLAGDDDNPYTRKILNPIYEPTEELQPAVETLRNRERTEALQAEIREAELPAHIEAFLLEAAERHTRFDFAKIAEYYAHAPDNVQHLMERSALVIIDFDSAIANGFVRLTEETARHFEADHPDA